MASAPLSNPISRPEFMATLGLLSPYTLDDVKAAYRAKAMDAHPDRGGSMADFMKIQEAYQRALEYIEFFGDRRKWIAHQVDGHLRQQEVAAEVARLGGRTQFEEVDWRKHSVRDFSPLADRLRGIHLQDTAADDGFLTYLAEQPPRAPYLVELNLAGTRITDNGLRALTGLDLLRRLDLSGTQVTDDAVQAAVRSLPSLEWVGVDDSGVGWLSRWRLRAMLRERKTKGSHPSVLVPSS